MNIITAQKLSKSFTGRQLLDNADFSMQDGEKVGIIGINGTGKSTLLRILAGDIEPDSGEVILSGHLVLRYLPQNPIFREEETVLEAVLERADSHQDSWDREGEAKAMLTRLELDRYDQKVSELSGGQKKRLALASTLLSGADVLILDEPTNHLDNSMCDWLEDYLKRFRGSLIMITHDRYFLDSVCNRIVEVDKGSLYSYDSNYEGYLELKAEREEYAQAAERKRQSILRVELEWMRRGARARSTKQKAHIQRYEKLAAQTGPTTDSKVELGSVASRLGRTTIELEHVSKAWPGKALFDDFSYIFLRRDRIGFIGPNGCGKTSLMKIIAGLEQPDTGHVEIGQTVKIGYYAQEIDDGSGSVEKMDPNQRVIDYIKDTAEYVRTDEGLISASKMLERFLFTSEMQYSLIGKLSGGEKRRLNLLRVLMEQPNVLILDEPTNDLDVTTMAILEDFLDSYEGIVITVSHDRYFLDRIVTRIFAFENGTITQYEGGYTDYKLKCEAMQQPVGGSVERTQESSPAREAVEAGNVTAKGKPVLNAPKLKFTFKENKEYETIEEDIASLEARIEELEAQMNDAARDFVKLADLEKQRTAAEQELEEKMERWEYLEDKAAQIAAQNE